MAITIILLYNYCICALTVINTDQEKPENVIQYMFISQVEDFKLFSNVEDIYTVNLAFWMAHLSRVVENVSNF